MPSGAATDHDSVLFDVDTRTGLVKRGITNKHWYQLWTTSGTWLPGRDFQVHPDSNVQVVGSTYIINLLSYSYNCTHMKHLGICSELENSLKPVKTNIEPSILAGNW